MTNDNLKEDLDLIKSCLWSLQIISDTDIKLIDVRSFIDLMTDRFVDLENNLVSSLNSSQVFETLQSDGKEAAQALFDKLHSN